MELNDPRLCDPTILLLAGRMALAKRQQPAPLPWWEGQGLAALLAAARHYLIAVEVEYAGTDTEPPRKGETYHFPRPGPHHNSLATLLEEARRYDEARRREQAP